MKNKLAVKWVQATLVIAAFAGVSTAQAINSPYLLKINDSNPAAVVITATGNFPTANATTNIGNDGVDILNFLTTGLAYNEFGNLNGSLKGGGLSVPYNDYELDNQTTGGGTNLNFDLNLFVDVGTTGNGNTETFTTSQAAFTGTWTIDLTSIGVSAGDLPAAGAQGNIMSGYNYHPGAVIGQWQVVPAPEPSTVTIFAVGALVALANPIRRRYFSKK